MGKLFISKIYLCTFLYNEKKIQVFKLTDERIYFESRLKFHHCFVTIVTFLYLLTRNMANLLCAESEFL